MRFQSCFSFCGKHKDARKDWKNQRKSVTKNQSIDNLCSLNSLSPTTLETGGHNQQFCIHLVPHEKNHCGEVRVEEQSAKNRSDASNESTTTRDSPASSQRATCSPKLNNNDTNHPSLSSAGSNLEKMMEDVKLEIEALKLRILALETAAANKLASDGPPSTNHTSSEALSDKSFEESVDGGFVLDVTPTNFTLAAAAMELFQKSSGNLLTGAYTKRKIIDYIKR